jgi:hypothetical protein
VSLTPPPACSRSDEKGRPGPLGARAGLIFAHRRPSWPAGACRALGAAGHPGHNESPPSRRAAPAPNNLTLTSSRRLAPGGWLCETFAILAWRLSLGSTAPGGWLCAPHHPAPGASPGASDTKPSPSWPPVSSRTSVRSRKPALQAGSQSVVPDQQAPGASPGAVAAPTPARSPRYDDRYDLRPCNPW